MKIRSNVKAGKLAANHNQSVKGLRIRAGLKAGKLAVNHNQAIAR